MDRTKMTFGSYLFPSWSLYCIIAMVVGDPEIPTLVYTSRPAEKIMKITGEFCLDVYLTDDLVTCDALDFVTCLISSKGIYFYPSNKTNLHKTL